MDDELDALNRLRHEAPVAQIPLKELDALTNALEIFEFSTREVVQHADLVALVDQLVHDVRANEASASCDQNAQAG